MIHIDRDWTVDDRAEVEVYAPEITCANRGGRERSRNYHVSAVDRAGSAHRESGDIRGINVGCGSGRGDGDRRNDGIFYKSTRRLDCRISGGVDVICVNGNRSVCDAAGINTRGPR